MVVTRFNPSANGPLHLGHAYMALVNEAYARECGGRFIVRFDDSHPLYIRTLGQDRIDRLVGEQQTDLEWLGINADVYIRQKDIVAEIEEQIEFGKWRVFKEESLPWVADDTFFLSYPFTSQLTIEKVLMDNKEHITHLIRGVDLLSEFSLYQYCCLCLDLPLPRHIYLPRLKWQRGNMSKSTGARFIGEMRSAGYTPEEVRGMLESSCLHNPAFGWSIENIKPEPVWGL
jgi:glutamyl/glutaminyl-tRNA synthetase